MRLIALLTLALSVAAVPALAQDRTPPTTDLRAYTPPIDWTSPRPFGSDFDGLATDRTDMPRQSEDGSADRH